MIYCSGHSCMPFLCLCPCASSNCMHYQTTSCILSKCASFLYCARAHDSPSCFKLTWIGNNQNSTVAFVELKYQKVSFDTMATFTFLAKWKCMASFVWCEWVIVPQRISRLFLGLNWDLLLCDGSMIMKWARAVFSVLIGAWRNWKMFSSECFEIFYRIWYYK